MRQSEWQLLSLTLIVVACEVYGQTQPKPQVQSLTQQQPQKPAPALAPSAPPARSNTPTCIDVGSAVDAIPSVGKEQVPLTADPETNYRDMEGAQALNKKYTAEKVEKLVFDDALDLPSRARLLSDFRCWGNWKRQHDLYRKVVKDNHCALLRHRAVQLLEFDMCNDSTITVLIAEYGRSLYPQTKEIILRKMGMSKDKRAVRLVEEAMRSSSKVLSRAAKEGKSAGDAQPCMPQEPTGKPYYGYMDISDICEGVSDGGGLVKDASGDEPDADQDKKGDPARKAGGASTVNFGN